MGSKRNVGGRDRIVRAVLAVVLTVVAVSSLRSGKRKTGLLAGVGALGFGFNATTGYCGMNDTLGVDTTTDDGTPTGTSDTTPGASADTGTDAEPESVEVKPGSDEGGGRASLTCAGCGEPIRVGQGRRPNEAGETVHDSCA